MKLGARSAVVGVLALPSCGSPESTAPRDLSGIWDVIATSPHGPSVPLVIKLDAQRVEVIAPGGTFSAQRTATGFNITYAEAAGSASVVATRENGGALEFGSFPVDLSGTWTFRTSDPDDGYGCNAALSGIDISAACARTAIPRWIGGYVITNGSATGRRTVAEPSIFGDLGGTWEAETASGRKCTFRFHDTTFGSQCGRLPLADDLGGIQVTFSGDTASGTSNRGIEFSARRR